MDNWCTIESDPAVFRELMEKLGVCDIDVEEIYALGDEQYLKSLEPIYGFIFLFKWTSETRKNAVVFDPDVFFAKQAINNACATQAILSVLFNIDQLEIGPVLNNVKAFCEPLDFYSRGLAIGESEDIRTIHNSFAKPEPFVFTESKKSKKDDEVYHFVAYILKKNNIYELDGLQEGPILIKEEVNKNTWLNSLTEVLQSRIEAFSDKEIRFNLLAITQSREKQFRIKLEQTKAEIAYLYNKACGLGLKGSVQQFIDFNINDYQGKVDNGLDNIDKSFIEAKLFELSQLKQSYEQVIQEFKKKKDRETHENERRRHNYIPMIFELFKIAAEKGQLEQLYNEAVDMKK